MQLSSNPVPATADGIVTRESAYRAGGHHAPSQPLGGTALWLPMAALWIFSGSVAHGADLIWNGGFNDSWHQEFNWDPVGSPFSVNRVPAEFDDVMITVPFNDSVRLYGDTNAVDSLFLANDNDLFTNGFKLTVEDGGSALVTVNGTGSLLSVSKHAANSALTAFEADNVRLEGARMSIVGVAEVAGLLEVRGIGEISTAAGATLTVGRLAMAPALFSSGTFTLAGVSTFHSTGASQNTVGTSGSSVFNIQESSSATFDGALRIGGTVGDPIVNVLTNGRLLTHDLTIGGSGSATDTEVNVSGLGSRINQFGTSTLTIGGADGSTLLRLSNEAHIRTGSGQITLNDTAWLAMFKSAFADGGGDFTAFGNVLVDGGRISGSGGSTFTLNAGRDMVVQNGGRVELDNHVDLREGSDLTVTDSRFAIEPDGGGAALTVGAGVTSSAQASGAQADFDLDGSVNIGENGGTGSVGLSNDAVGFFRFLNMGFVPWVDTHGSLAIESGAQVSMFGSANIIGAGQNSEAHVVITGQDSALTMGGNASVLIGTSGDFGHAQVDVTDHALLRLNTGAGAINIRKLGVMTVENATVDTQGSAGITNRGHLHVGAFGLVNLGNGGGFDNDGGLVSGHGVIDLNGGTFDNATGTLSPGNSIGELTISAGDFISDINSVLEIELGGTGRGGYDALLIGGDAVFDGELRLSLTDGYVPLLGDSYDIVTALTVAGGFDTVTCNDCLGREFGVQFGAGLITLSVTAVPLPGAIWLFGAGLATLLARRRPARSVDSRPLGPVRSRLILPVSRPRPGRC